MEGYHAHPDLAPNLGAEGEDSDQSSEKRSLVQRVLGLGKDKPTDEEQGLTEAELIKEHEAEKERDRERQETIRLALAGRAMSEPPGLGVEGGEKVVAEPEGMTRAEEKGVHGEVVRTSPARPRG